MRVRPPADSIRNLERLMAFDEAAGSRGDLPGNSGQIHDAQPGYGILQRGSGEEARLRPGTVTNRHPRLPSRGLTGGSGTLEPF